MKLKIKLFKRFKEDKKVRIIFLLLIIIFIFVISFKFANDSNPFIYFNF